MAGILSYPLTYRGLTLQGHFSTAGVYDRTKELNTYLVEQFDFARLQIRDQREGLHLVTGGMFGPATKQLRYLSLRGSIRADGDELLEDMAGELYAHFDIENAQDDQPQFRGEHLLDFYTPTNIAGYANPVHELFLARPVGHPQLSERRSVGQTMAFRLELACIDPRRYLYDIDQVTFSAGMGWTQILPNWTVDQGAEVWPFLLIDLSGEGGSGFTITDDISGDQFLLDLSGVSSDIAVDMQTMDIYRNSDGARRDYLRASDVNSWLPIAAGGTQWTISGHTGVTEVLVGYRQARS
jgi:hypothetical protein